MTAPNDKFSRWTIAIIALAIIAATALTVEGPYLALKTFVLDNPNDPLTKAGGLSPAQDTVKAKGNDRAASSRPPMDAARRPAAYQDGGLSNEAPGNCSEAKKRTDGAIHSRVHRLRKKRSSRQ